MSNKVVTECPVESDKGLEHPLTMATCLAVRSQLHHSQPPWHAHSSLYLFMSGPFIKKILPCREGRQGEAHLVRMAIVKFFI